MESDFDKFWKIYDKDIGREFCLIYWNELSSSDKKKIFETLPGYIKDTPEIKYRLNPLNYLKKRKWKNAYGHVSGKEVTWSEFSKDKKFSWRT